MQMKSERRKLEIRNGNMVMPFIALPQGALKQDMKD